MLIVFYVILVWLKIIVGNSLLLLWLWIARDRGVSGVAAKWNYIAALLFWAAPWVLFLLTQADLYQGHCGLRQGIHECGLAEFLWGRLRWLRYGLVLGIGDGFVEADGVRIYEAKDLRVGLFQPGAQPGA